MRNAIAAVLSVRSGLLKRQGDPPPTGSPISSSASETAGFSSITTSPAVLATTSVEVAVATVNGFNGANTSFSLATVTYTPLVVSVTGSSVDTTVGILVSTSTDPNGAFTNTIFAPASFAYTPSVTVSTVGALNTTSSTPPATSSNVTTSTGTAQSTATSSLSPTGSKSPDKSNGDLSKGAVAGIAVGCAIIGALITVGVLFFLMKDKLQKKHRSGTTSSRQPGYSGSNQPGYLSGATLRSPRSDRDKGRTVEQSVEEATVETILEQPKDDGSVKQSVAALFKAIEDHAENYYVDTPARGVRTTKEPTTRAKHLPTGITAQNDVEFELLLADRLSRSSAITSLITAHVLDAIDFFGATERSFLPQMVTSFLRSSAGQVKDNQRSRLLLSRWRTSTASLFTPDDTSQRNFYAQKAVDDLMDDIDSIVGSYIRPETDKDRRQHLAKICKRAQELGLMLLSQPAEWTFHWSDAATAQKPTYQTHRSEKSKKPAFVVQPQLQRVTDNVACKLERPLIVLDWQLLH